MAGRPTKFNPERANRILDLIRKGNFKETAARAAGVHISTLDRWIVAGKQGKNKQLRLFCEALEQAEAEGELVGVAKIIDKLGDSSIPAILEYMRRRYPHWNVADKREITMKEDKNEAVIDLRLENLLAKYNTGRRKVPKDSSSE